MAKEKKEKTGGGRLRVGKGRGKRGALPTKRVINLADYDAQPMNVKLAIPAILLILAVAFAISKFAVVDRLMAVSRAEAEVAEAQRQVDAAYRKIDSYGELNELYAHYTFSGWTDEERHRTDREDILGLLRNVILPEVDVSTWSVKGNRLNITMTAETLEDINRNVQAINADELVNFSTVSIADGKEVPRVVLNGDEEETTIDNTVTAQVVVYLNPGEGVDFQ